MTTPIIIAPSILSADFGHLATQAHDVLLAGADVIHFDVMDHHYVPNLSFGSVVCSALRRAKVTAPIDVHLMVTDPEAYIAPFAKAGANRLTFHPETSKNPETTCKKIQDAGMSAGIAFNPDQAVTISENILPLIDMVLLMSVFPGFGGQKFIPSSLEKIKETKKLISKYSIKLGIDGGIKVDNIRQVVNAGADFIVMGSGIFSTDNYSERLKQIREALQ